MQCQIPRIKSSRRLPRRESASLQPTWKNSPAWSIIRPRSRSPISPMELQPLDFEKPIFELERRLQELKEHSREHDVDLDSEVKAIESKLRDTRREIYGNLTAWQRVQIARHV